MIILYGGGQITNIDLDETVTLHSHRGWGPDGMHISIL